MVAINQNIDMETVSRIAAELGYEVQDVGFDESQYLPAASAESAEALEHQTRFLRKLATSLFAEDPKAGSD